MAFDRKHWKLSFPRDDNPEWPCPHCGRTALTHDQNALTIVEVAESVAAHSHEAWDPDWIEERFACVYQCGSCREPVTVVGKVTVRETQISFTEELIERTLYPQYVFPPVRFFEVPEACPASLHQEVFAAFQLFWCSPASAASHVRTSVEALMDALRVRKVQRSSKSAC